MKIAGCGLAILLFLPAGFARAQDEPAQPQTLSPAEAARRAREQKQSQPKATKVWTNDTMPKTSGVVNVVGQAPAESDDSATAGENAAGAPGSAQGAAKSAESSSADSSSARGKLQSLKADLNALRRKYDLDSQMYYSKPDYSKDKAGADRLADEQAQINAKQQEIEEAQRQVESLEAQAKAPKAGAEAGGGPNNDSSQPNPNTPPN